jgi:malonate decarboxylase delta subunit
MERLSFDLEAPREAGGTRPIALVGVVASANLEVLVERTAPAGRCTFAIDTAAVGFGDIWEAVLRDVVARRNAGGLHISVNDGGARPDTVALRLAQAIRMIEEEAA